MVDALHSVNTKHSDFNQIFVNLLGGEPIKSHNFKVFSMFLDVNLTPFYLFDQYSTFQVCFTCRILHLMESNFDSTELYMFHFYCVFSNDATYFKRH